MLLTQTQHFHRCWNVLFHMLFSLPKLWAAQGQRHVFLIHLCSYRTGLHRRYYTPKILRGRKAGRRTREEAPPLPTAAPLPPFLFKKLSTKQVEGLTEPQYLWAIYKPRDFYIRGRKCKTRLESFSFRHCGNGTTGYQLQQQRSDYT